jgi:hypothetical protein
MTAVLSASVHVGCSNIIIFELSVTVKPSPLPSHVGNIWVCKSVLYKVCVCGGGGLAMLSDTEM